MEQPRITVRSLASGTFVLCVLFFVGTALRVNDGAALQSEGSAVGTFQLAVEGGRVWRINTCTGEVWEHRQVWRKLQSLENAGAKAPSTTRVAPVEPSAEYEFIIQRFDVSDPVNPKVIARWKRSGSEADGLDEREKNEAFAEGDQFGGGRWAIRRIYPQRNEVHIRDAKTKGTRVVRGGPSTGAN